MTTVRIDDLLYLEGYGDNGTAQSSLLTLHLVGEFMVFIQMIDARQHCLVVEAKIMRTWEKMKIYKDRAIQ